MADETIPPSTGDGERTFLRKRGPQNLVGTRYYTYALLRGDTGDVFYIGYGQRDRLNAHTNRQNLVKSTYKVHLIKKLIRDDKPIIAVKIREGLTRDQARYDERVIVSALGRYPNGPLLNATAGGDGPYDLSPEHSERRRLKLKSRVVSMETRQRQSAAHKGKKLSPEHARNAALGRVGVKKNYTDAGRAALAANGRATGLKQRGKPKSPEHNAKVAVALTGRKRPKEVGAKVSAANRGRIGYTNGTSVRRLKPDQPIPEGWWRCEKGSRIANGTPTKTRRTAARPEQQQASNEGVRWKQQELHF